MSSQLDEAEELGARGTSFLNDAADTITTEPVEPIGGDSAPSVPEEPAKADAKADDRTRDDKGRFAKRIVNGGLEGQPEAAPPAQADTPAAPVDPAAAAPAGEGAPEGDAPADPNALPEPEPLTFRAWGQEISPEGVQYVRGHGAFVPEAQMGEMRQAYARAARHDHIVERNTALEGERRRFEHDLTGERATFDYIANQLSTDTLTRLGMPADAAEKFIERLELDIKRLKLDHAAKFDSAGMALPSAPVSDNDLAEGFDHRLDQAAENPDWREMFAHPAIGKELRDELRAQRRLFEVRWEDLRPEDQRNLLSNGAIPGAPVLNVKALHQRIGELVGRFKKFTATTTGAASRAGQVAARVAAANATVSHPVAARPAPVVPPAATASASASPTRTASSGRNPSHFEGKTPEERRKAVKAWWDDPEAI